MKFENILHRYAVVARQEILRNFIVTSCIASTRITIRVMRELGIAAEPLSVQLIVGNREWTRRIIDKHEPIPEPKDFPKWCDDTGAWSVGVGCGDARLNGWPGHLVAHLPEHHILIDASVDQANRPAKGIVLPPVLTPRPVPRRFLAGDIALETRLHGVFLQYLLVPNDTYRASKDWTEFDRIKPVVKRILKLMEAV